MRILLLSVVLCFGSIVASCDWIHSNDVEAQAEFPGGYPELRKYLSTNIVYPEVALELGISGKCYVKFVVDRFGDISTVHVVKGVPECAECDEEVVRVVKKMPRWKPALRNGRPVNSFYYLPVTFKVE